ncbi:hypothetical protein ACERII_05320 [Evansella sp. AB-rgal1]|uniref:hypothetical protein n=1 Tax=Evansella sp. AB-rgal1 TaxID=3242696 RepID=UPI00359D928A
MVDIYPNKNLLVVSHGLLIGETLKGLLHDETTGRKMGNTSVTTVKHNQGLWEYLVYYCVKHLDE